jgi:hypothetical protein
VLVETLRFRVHEHWRMMMMLHQVLMLKCRHARTAIIPIHWLNLSIIMGVNLFQRVRCPFMAFMSRSQLSLLMDLVLVLALVLMLALNMAWEWALVIRLNMRIRMKTVRAIRRLMVAPKNGSRAAAYAHCQIPLRWILLPLVQVLSRDNSTQHALERLMLARLKKKLSAGTRPRTLALFVYPHRVPFQRSLARKAEAARAARAQKKVYIQSLEEQVGVFLLLLSDTD